MTSLISYGFKSNGRVIKILGRSDQVKKKRLSSTFHIPIQLYACIFQEIHQDLRMVNFQITNQLSQNQNPEVN